MFWKSLLSMLGVLVVSLAIGAACTGASASRIVPVALTLAELKGSTSTAKLAPPAEDITKLSAGYGYKAPGYDNADKEKWEVATYVFLPSSVTVKKSDKVNLRVFGINGDLHAARLLDPHGKVVGSPMVWNRGREYTFSFVAEKSGVYRLVCDSHSPTMEATFYALP